MNATSEKPVHAPSKAKNSRVLSLKGRMNQRSNLFARVQQAAFRDPELKPVQEALRQLWLSDVALDRRYQLSAAERKDKGVILWEVFHPRTSTPLSGTILDTQRHVTRTPNRIFVKGEYLTHAAQWEVATGDPWQQLRAEMDRTPFDLVKFRQYGRDIDEAVRLHRRKSTFIVTTDFDQTYELRRETADEAKRDIENRFLSIGAKVLKVEEKEAA